MQSDPEGSLWRDPPHYWEQIVFPAYVKAHTHLFENGDHEKGSLSADAKEKILLFEAENISMEGLVDGSLAEIHKLVNGLQAPSTPEVKIV